MRSKTFPRVIAIALAIVLAVGVMLTGIPVAAADDPGNPVPPDVARRVAVNQLNRASLQKSMRKGSISAEDKKLLRLDTSSISEVFTETNNGKNIYYVINLKPEGWVIVSADYVAYPIIGYSDNGSYSTEKHPPAFDAWIGNVKEEIYSAIATKQKPHKEATDAWQSFGLPPADFVAKELAGPGGLALAASVLPLLSTIWGQGGVDQPDPFWILWWLPSEDLYCPAERNWAGYYQVAPTGCVATAMGQIMKYWKWPDNGKDSHTWDPPYATSLWNTYGPYTVNYAYREYNWAIMPNNVIPKISGGQTAGDRAVAQLLRDIGNAVNMDYKPWGSGATMDSHAGWNYPRQPSALEAYQTHFKYSQSADHTSRGNLSDADWGNKLRVELDAGRPVLYDGESASDPTKGHAFVCDGYNAYSQFHFNWGWDGLYNGYFYLSSLTPLGHNYTSGQAAVFDLKPDYPPVAANDAYSVNEDQTVSIAAPGVLGNDSDRFGEPLTAIKNDSPTHGTLTLNANGSFIYRPNANFNGTDSFTYHASDSRNDSSVVRVTITVNSVNDPPVAVNDAYSVNENQTLNVSAPGVLSNDSDVDGNLLAAVMDTAPAGGTLTLNANGSFIYKSNANFSGADSFRYHVFDGQAGSNVATVAINVVPGNRPPVAYDQSVPTDEDTSKEIILIATDIGGDVLTYAVADSPSHGSLSGTPPNVTYTPAKDYNGPDIFTFKANDGQGDSNTAIISITVNAVNDAPVAAPQSFITDEDTRITLTLASSDVDGDALTFTIVAMPLNGTLTGTAPDLTYTPSVNWNGTDSFTFKAFDGLVDSNIAAVSIKVNPVNDPPELEPIGDKSTNERQLLQFTVSATDPDDSSLTYSASNLPQGASFDAATRTFAWTPEYGREGIYPGVRLTVSDGKVSVFEDITITVILQATVNIDPNTLNLKSNGGVVTAYIELPKSYDATKIDISSVRLNGSVPALAKPTAIGDYNKNKIPDLMVKFDRSEIQKNLTAGDKVKITISGTATGIIFEGEDYIKVIK